MGNNWVGGNPSNGANYHTRNGVTRDPKKFKNQVLPMGVITFLLCEGNMRGAVHDGKTCGGAAHFPLFHPSCDFTALYEAINCPEDTNNNGTSDSLEGGDTEEPQPTLWTLLSKLPNPHPDSAAYAFVGVLGDGAVHPVGSDAGQAINGWNVFTTCSVAQPPDDSNGHYWFAGSINAQTITGFTRSNPDSAC